MRSLKFAALVVMCASVSSLWLACGSSGSSATTTAPSSAITESKPSTVLSAVSSAVATAGTGMGSAGVSTSSVGSGDVQKLDISQDCSVHAQPLRAGATVNQTDPDYPGKFMYCKLAYNTQDPESVQGAFAQTQSISCLLESAGLVWDGAAHTYTITPSSPCFSAQQLTNMGGGGQSMTVTATGSTPAAFNTYFDRGIDMTISGFGHIQLAVSASATKIEFMDVEDGTTVHPNKFDVYAASLNYTTGEIRYELRSDRFNDNSDNSSGGFSRHQRIYVGVTVSGQTVTGLKSVSAAQSEIYNGTSGSGQSGWGGQMITASGDTTNGIKARLWLPSNGTQGQMPAALNDLTNPHSWYETTNTHCYTSSSDTATTCSTGIAIPTTNAASSFPFTEQGTGFTAGATWAAAHKAWTFTAVDPSLDTQ